MKLKIHKVLTVGAFIYAFMLVFGIFFMTKQMTPVEVVQEEVVMLLSGDGTTDNSSGTNKKSGGLNSRMLIEDDDDSAKDLLNEMHFTPDVYIIPGEFHLETYAPHQQEITTPPPKG